MPYKVAPNLTLLSPSGKTSFTPGNVVLDDGSVVDRRYPKVPLNLPGDGLSPAIVKVLLKSGHLIPLDEMAELDYLPTGTASAALPNFSDSNSPDGAVPTDRARITVADNLKDSKPVAEDSVVWDFDPETLKNKSLKELNDIAAGHDADAPVFDTKDSARKLMSADFNDDPSK